MSTVLAFAAAFLVAVGFTVFAITQTRALVEAIPRLRLREGQTGDMSEDIQMAKAKASQSLEVAYGFPASILTLVAYADLFRWATIASFTLLGIAILMTILFTRLSRLDDETTRWYLWWRIKGVSLVGISVVLANAVGFILAITFLTTSRGT